MGFSLGCSLLSWRDSWRNSWRKPKNPPPDASPSPSSSKTGSSGSTSPTDDDCPICHDRVGTPPDADSPAESWLHLPCGHRFGSLCLASWILSGSSDGRCPLCRRNLHASCGHLSVPRARLSPRERAWFAASTPHDRPVADMCAFCIHRAGNVAPDDPRKAPRWQAGLYFLEQANARRSPLTPGEWDPRACDDRLWRMWYELKLASVVWPARRRRIGEPWADRQLQQHYQREPMREMVEDLLGEEDLLPPKRGRRRHLLRSSA